MTLHDMNVFLKGWNDRFEGSLDPRVGRHSVPEVRDSIVGNPPLTGGGFNFQLIITVVIKIGEYYKRHMFFVQRISITDNIKSGTYTICHKVLILVQ